MKNYSLTADAAANAQTYLMNVAALLRSPQFAHWVGNIQSRFAWTGERLKEKLVLDFVNLFSHSSPNSTHAEAFAFFAQHCERAANLMTRTSGVAPVKVFAPELTLAGCTKTVLALVDGLAENIMALAYSHCCDFDLLAGLYELNDYADVRMTLETTTGHDAFEAILADLSEDYLLAGYPSDLLGENARAIRSGVAGHAIALHPERCITEWLTADVFNREAAAMMETHNLCLLDDLCQS